MDDEKKKIIMIVVMVSCLVLAGAIFYMTTLRGGGGGGGGRNSIPFKCMNPKCGATFELSTEEYQDMMRDSGPMMMPGMGPIVIECDTCGEKTATMAEKCTKCDHIFFPNYNNTDDYPDRCPECGYSSYEE